MSSVHRYGLGHRHLSKLPSSKRPLLLACVPLCTFSRLAVVVLLATNRQVRFLSKGPRENGTRPDVNFRRDRPLYPPTRNMRTSATVSVFGCTTMWSHTFALFNAYYFPSLASLFSFRTINEQHDTILLSQQ
jgi:hypothetical protein